MQKQLKLSKLPKRILIIGILFCLSGLLAIWGVVSNFIQSASVLGELVINNLPIGIGLLMGRQWSQWWARILIVVGYIFCTASIIVAIVSPEKIYISWFNQEFAGKWKLPLFLALTVVLILILVYMHKLLYSQKAKSYFNRLN